MDNKTYLISAYDLLYSLLAYKKIQNFIIDSKEKTLTVNNTQIKYATIKALYSDTEYLYRTLMQEIISRKERTTFITTYNIFDLLARDSLTGDYAFIQTDYDIITYTKDHKLCQLYKCPVISVQFNTDLLLIDIKTNKVLLGKTAQDLTSVLHFIKKYKKLLLQYYSRKINSYYLNKCIETGKQKYKREYRKVITELCDELVVNEYIKHYSIHKYYIKMDNKRYYGLTDKQLFTKVYTVFKQYFPEDRTNIIQEDLVADNFKCIQADSYIAIPFNELDLEAKSKFYYGEEIKIPKIIILDRDDRIPIQIQAPYTVYNQKPLSKTVITNLPALYKFLKKHEKILIQAWQEKWNDVDLYL